MASSFLEVETRNFNPIPIPELSKEAREAVNAALKSMSEWRNEIAELSEKDGNRVIEKMAAAAAALGWPQQIVDTARTQMQSIAQMQIKTMDHMMDAWEEQLKLSASPSAMLSKLKSWRGFAPAGGGLGLEDWQKAAMNPLQFWMQLAEQWQKSLADTMNLWGTAGKPH